MNSAATPPPALASDPATAPVAQAVAVAAASEPHRGVQWRLRLLGALQASSGDVRITRWPSRPTALLLATLALEPGREHPREALVERLWPGAPPEAGRNRLRQALSSLRRLFEAPGLPPVFDADRHAVRLAPQALVCDAVEFERALAEHRFAEARALYAGELMPGVYDDWVVELRARLAARHEALDSLAISAGLAPPPRGIDDGPAAWPQGAAETALPPAGAPLLGRDAELQALAAALARGGLVSVTGTGGCGKTRLVLEAPRRSAGAFERVVFVPLAGCHDAAEAASQLRAALDLPPPGGTAGGSPLQPVLLLLASRRLLLVLDNFEQVAGGAALLRTLQDGAPGTALLVTSRRAVGIEGEQELALAPLPLPDPDAPLADIARNPGVALFVRCAQAVRPDFQVTPRNGGELAALCRALEGLPLAIELAAARARAHSVAELQQALQQPLALLTRTGPRGRAGTRHDSMRAAIAWSWALLAPPARALLAGLSVFRGSFTVAAAEAVTGEPGLRARIEELAADSLLRAVGSAGAGESTGDTDDGEAETAELRFVLLEVIRQYAAEQLEPAQARALRERHRAHALALLQALPAGAAPPEAELPNLHAALRDAVADGEPAMALSLGLALQPQWQRHGMAPELLALLTSTALGVAIADRELHSRACAQLALAHLDAGGLAAARDLAGRALALAGDHGAARALALCTRVRVVADGERHASGLAAWLDEALALAAAAAQPALQALAVELQAALAMRFEHRPQAAEGLLQFAEALYRLAGQAHQARRLRYERALCLRQMGRRQAALEQAELCEVECAHDDDGVHRARAINLQGVILADLRRWDDAIAAYRRCVQVAWVHHVHYWLVFALWNHGRNLARLRRPLAAARLMAFAERYWTRHFAALSRDDEAEVRRVRRLVRVQVGRATAQAAWVEGAGWTLSQAVHAALHAGGESSPRSGG
jgi:predicted ATPase